MLGSPPRLQTFPGQFYEGILLKMPEGLKEIAAFLAGPYGNILILAWVLGGIWTAYRRVKQKGRRRKR